MEDNQERLRRAVTPRAECGWGCFCDACWRHAQAAEKQHLGTQRGDALGAELALYDALWRLAFGEPLGAARAHPEASPHHADGVIGDDSTSRNRG